MFAVVVQVEEPPDFGEGERGESSMEGWGSDLWLGRLVGWSVVLGWLSCWFAAPFLALWR